ncbi:hypothetical protein [Sphingopyxis sp. GW247-27LB]|uniref:hypothetical protein n=1 Tax=Sphingopyxis sp. GW247-27LB TaxID=2012632 RepID=UPI000BA7660B|nr:hypothetical protein [Sphingopyxis sp. GW247-27LB]PAL22654.1 hypothetical protein CD928_11375 [Sphingopyxis sp. GW247-27LB]
MKTFILSRPIRMTRRDGNNFQNVELGQLEFDARDENDPDNDPNLLRACVSILRDDDGNPVTREVLEGLKLEDGIKRGARKIFGDYPA